MRGLGIAVGGAFGLTLLAVGPLRWMDPPTTAFIARWESESGRAAAQQWRPLERISPQLALAVIAAEDQRFPDHRGFDFEAIREALKEGDRGANTLSQQVAKNLYLWSGRSWLRKGVEAWLTVWIELCWPKRRILEVYLNVAEFGPGTYGAEAAARGFFGRSAAALSERQAARLAAVLPSPRRMSAARPSAYVRERSAAIVRQMRQLGGTAALAPLRLDGQR